MGCPVDAKQAMHVTYLPDALADGLTLVVNCPIDRLERQGARMTGVKGRAHLPAAGRAAGQEVTVAAKTVVVSAGAINSPALLLRSGIDAKGRVGRRTFLHPVIGILGRYEDPVLGFMERLNRWRVTSSLNPNPVVSVSSLRRRLFIRCSPPRCS